MLILFVSRPFCSADSDEERLVAPRLAGPFDQSKRKAHAIIQTLTAELVGSGIGHRGQERSKEVPVGCMNLNKVKPDSLTSFDGGNEGVFNPLKIVFGHWDRLRVLIVKGNVTGAVNYSTEGIGKGLEGSGR